MSTKVPGPKSTSRLHRAAEVKLGRDLARPDQAFPSITTLLHELQVHQVELEQQNEELRRVEGEREQRILELEALNARLEQAHRQLRQADKLAAIGQLAAGVAHEVNSPLAYVRTNLNQIAQGVDQVLEVLQTTELAKDSCAQACPLHQLVAQRTGQDLVALRADLRELVSDSCQGLDQVSQLVSDLRSFAHPDTGQTVLASLQELVEAALRVVAGTLGGRVRLVRAYAPVAPRLACRPMQLQQVFMNVILNAAQALGPDGTVTVRTGQAGAEAWVEVQDDGAGIQADHLARLFEPFFTTKPVGEGTGLGLSIAHGIVRAHGGRFEVRSEVGQGSTFRIVLPLDAEAPLPAPREAGPERFRG